MSNIESRNERRIREQRHFNKMSKRSRSLKSSDEKKRLSAHLLQHGDRNWKNKIFEGEE